MTEETTITIPDDVRAAFMALYDDYLADVLRLWDCDLKRWHEPFAMLFRFETDDIMVWCENEALRHSLGAVGDGNVSDHLPETVKASIKPDACLCWLRDKSYGEIIGSTMVSGELLKRFDYSDSILPSAKTSLLF